MDRNRQDDRVVGRPARGGEPLRVVGGVVGRVVDTLVHVVEALLGLGGGAAASGTTEPYRPHPSLPQTSAAAQRLAARQRAGALQRMAEDMRAGKHLSAADVRQLNRADLTLIKAHGDDGLRALVRRQEEELARASTSGRSREHRRGR